ncbi:MAG: HAD-IB family phosphatase, partial [Candidatus Micrarchaeota archaeon]|nr:HAD-IB family phosphatase [Candidatus Micrarchaeota archaeon]
MEKAVITDVDGTLCEYVGISWVRFLGANGHISEGQFEQHEALVEAYDKGLLDHIAFTREWVMLYGQIVRGREEKEMRALARRFFAGFRKGIPESSAKLVREFRAKGYKVVAITASPKVPVDLVMEHLGITEYHSTEPEIRNGKYTGEIESTMHLSERGKEDIVREAIMSRGIDTSQSFALGDTIHDLPLLESVAYPIALNPKGRLRHYAEENGFWVANYDNVRDVVERIERSNAKSLFEQMKFVYEVGALKCTPRSGWALLQVESPENVAEHSFRSAIIAYLLAVEEGEDPYKCAFTNMVHDIAEARIGDMNKVALAYVNEKPGSERRAFNDQVARLDTEKRKMLVEAWENYKSQKVADICKDADLLEALASAREYEYKGHR